MKTLKRLFTLCVIFVFSTLSLTACKNNNNDTQNQSGTSQSTESFCIEFSSEIEIECASKNIISEQDGKLYVVENSKITPVLKELKNNPNKTFLELGYIPSIIVNDKNVDMNAEIVVSKDLNISLQKTYIKLAGVVVYQNHPTNTEFETITNPLDFITHNISVSTNSISTINSFIATAAFDNNMHITSNTKSFMSDSSNHLTVGIEVYHETTKTYTVLILKDSFGKVYYQPVGMNKLKSNGTNMVYEYSISLTPNTLSSTQKFTLKISNNFSATEK